MKTLLAFTVVSTLALAADPAPKIKKGDVLTVANPAAAAPAANNSVTVLSLKPVGDSDILIGLRMGKAEYKIPDDDGVATMQILNLMLTQEFHNELLKSSNGGADVTAYKKAWAQNKEIAVEDWPAAKQLYMACMEKAIYMRRLIRGPKDRGAEELKTLMGQMKFANPVNYLHMAKLGEWMEHFAPQHVYDITEFIGKKDREFEKVPLAVYMGRDPAAALKRPGDYNAPPLSSAPSSRPINISRSGIMETSVVKMSGDLKNLQGDFYANEKPKKR